MKTSDGEDDEPTSERVANIKPKMSKSRSSLGALGL